MMPFYFCLQVGVGTLTGQYICIFWPSAKFDIKALDLDKEKEMLKVTKQELYNRAASESMRVLNRQYNPMLG